MIKLTASLVICYGVSSCYMSGDSITKHVEGRTAIRYGTACKLYIPGWVGEGVGVAGIVYLAWEARAVMSYELTTSRPQHIHKAQATA